MQNETFGLFVTIPEPLLKDTLLPFMTEIDRLCFMRTCKTAYRIVGRKPDINIQYQRAGFCAICKTRHTVSYRDRSSRMYAHPRCIDARHKHFTYFNGGRMNGLVYENKSGKFEHSSFNQNPQVQIFGPQYVDIINRDNAMTVSSLYRRLAPRNHFIMDYAKYENVLLTQHIWFFNHKNLIIEADKYFRHKEWHKVRITSRKKLDVYKLYMHRLLGIPERKTPKYPTNILELVNYVHTLCCDCMTFIDQMTIWHNNLKRKHGHDWFSEAHRILNNGTLEQTKVYVFSHIYNAGDLIVDLMNKELDIY